MFRIVFSRPVEVGGQLVSETTVEAERLEAISAAGEVVMTAAADVIARIDLGPAARTAQLRSRAANHGRAWTDEQRAELARLHGEGLTVPQLMERLERTRGGIRSELIRQGLLKREGTSPK
ncbi:hypothetical protein [Spirillospora sp. CA-294931]|uniref:hypothetical protein n=1 Tax=Spirillospora sp. CA-294931 TaxID=3240042 RepID=UPI003D923000